MSHIEDLPFSLDNQKILVTGEDKINLLHFLINCLCKTTKLDGILYLGEKDENIRMVTDSKPLQNLDDLKKIVSAQERKPRVLVILNEMWNDELAKDPFFKTWKDYEMTLIVLEGCSIPYTPSEWDVVFTGKQTYFVKDEKFTPNYDSKIFSLDNIPFLKNIANSLIPSWYLWTCKYFTHHSLLFNLNRVKLLPFQSEMWKQVELARGKSVKIPSIQFSGFYSKWFSLTHKDEVGTQTSYIPTPTYKNQTQMMTNYFKNIQRLKDLNQYIIDSQLINEWKEQWKFLFYEFMAECAINIDIQMNLSNQGKTVSIDIQNQLIDTLCDQVKNLECIQNNEAIHFVKEKRLSGLTTVHCLQSVKNELEFYNREQCNRICSN